MSADDFQTKYASVMESMLKTAVAETTKLFETMVEELKAEISRIKKENDDLKTKCSLYENGKNKPPVHTRETEPTPLPNYRSEKRDTAVQCDLVSLCTLLVEQRTQQNVQQQSSYEMTDYSLHDHTYDRYREENSHLEFTPLKVEKPSDDYSLESTIKEENDESTVAGGTEDEGPRINKVFSAGEILEKNDISVTLGLQLDRDRQRAQNQSPEHPHLKTGEQFITSEEQPLVTAQKKSVVEVVKEQQTVPQQECTFNVHCRREQIMEPTTQNKQITFDGVKNVIAEGDGSSQPICLKQGRPTEKTKRGHWPVKETSNSPSTNVMTVMEINSSVRLEEAEGSSVVNIANTTVRSDPQKSPVMLKKTCITQERADTTKDVLTIKVGVLPSSVSSTSGCSNENEKPSEYNQFLKNDASFPEVSSVNITLNPLPEKSQVPQYKHRERCSSVTLQDAMLLIEAMNQRHTPSLQTHCTPVVSTSQTLDKIPAKPQTLPLSTKAPMAAHVVLVTKPSTKQSPVCTPSPTHWVNTTHTTEAQTQIKAAIPKLLILTASNITEAQTQIKNAIPELPMATPSNITEAQVQIKDATPEFLMVTPPNITEAENQIKDALPELPIVTPSNIIEAQTQNKDDIPELTMVPSPNITEAQTQIKDDISEVPLVTPPNITKAQTQIEDDIPELPLVPSPNITEAQTQVKDDIPELPLVTPPNIIEAQTQIKTAMPTLSMVTPSNITEPQTQIQAAIPQLPKVTPPNIIEAQNQIKAAIPKLPMVTATHITAPQTQPSVAAKCITRPVIRLLIPSKQSGAIPHKLIVMPGFSFRPSAAPTARNIHLQPASRATGLHVGTTSRCSLSQKASFVTSQKMLSIIPPRLTTTLKGQQPDFLHSRKLIVVPNNVSLVASEKHQPKSFSYLSKNVAPTTEQESVESAHTSSQDLSVHVDAQTADNSPIVTATETCNSSKMFLPAEHLGPSSLSSVEKILSPFVRLTRLPVSVTTTDTVSVSELLSKGYPDSMPTLKQRATQVSVVTQPSEKPVVTSLKEPSVFVSAKTSQTSEEKSNIQAGILVSPETPINVGVTCVSRSVQTSLSPKASSPVLDISAVTSCTNMPSAGEPTSNLKEELFSMQDCVLSNTPPEEEKKSTGLLLLTSIPSKDSSDPHLQMTKTQFLAQLAVSPVIKAPLKDSSERDSSAETSKRSSLMSRLRSHFRVHLQTRRNETNSDPCTKTDVMTVSPKIFKLENHNMEMTIGEKSGVVGDVGSCKTAEGPIPESPQRSNLSKNALSLKRSFSEPTWKTKSTCKATSKSPESFSGQDCVGPKKTKTSSVSPQRFCSTKDSPSKKIKSGTSCKNLKSLSVCPRSISLTRGDTSPKQTKSPTVSPNRPSPDISASPETSSLSETGSNLIAVRHTMCTSTQVTTRQIKIESCSLNPIMIPMGTAAETKSENVSPSISPRKTEEATPAKKHRIFQDVASSKQNLRTLNSKKMARAKIIVKMKNSNLSKQRNKAGTSGDAVKICQSKSVWIPPNGTLNKDVTLPLLQVKKEPNSLVYLPSVPLRPIPVKAPPVVSPLEPLSVIGGRLLKNQCGECGRILSSNAALESHVSLHTGRRPFSCTLCGKGFPDSKSLKRHGRVHSNGKIHICHECGKGFVYRFSLSKHLQMVHRKIKPFVCQICHKSFFTRRDVESHIRTHTGEKPFQCNLCERKFARRVELNVHLRWHNGEKRHWCSYCGKGFLDLNNLKRHKYIHTGEKPHPCPHCPKKFTQSAHLKKHVKNVHKLLCGGT